MRREGRIGDEVSVGGRINGVQLVGTFGGAEGQRPMVEKGKGRGVCDESHGDGVDVGEADHDPR